MMKDLDLYNFALIAVVLREGSGHFHWFESFREGLNNKQSLV
jgi:hypothetical protein